MHVKSLPKRSLLRLRGALHQALGSIPGHAGGRGGGGGGPALPRPAPGGAAAQGRVYVGADHKVVLAHHFIGGTAVGAVPVIAVAGDAVVGGARGAQPALVLAPASPDVAVALGALAVILAAVGAVWVDTLQARRRNSRLQAQQEESPCQAAPQQVCACVRVTQTVTTAETARCCSLHPLPPFSLPARSPAGTSCWRRGRRAHTSRRHASWRTLCTRHPARSSGSSPRSKCSCRPPAQHGRLLSRLSPTCQHPRARFCRPSGSQCSAGRWRHRRRILSTAGARCTARRWHVGGTV